MSKPLPTLKLTIQKDTSVPLHQQLVTQLSLAIAGGELAEGTKLPSVRSLAARLGVHYNTVSGVYQELAKLGMVQSVRGSGVLVSALSGLAGAVPVRAHSSGESMTSGIVHRWLDQAVKEGMRTGISLAELQDLLQQAWQHQRVEGEKPILFVDEHADILPLFVSELNRVSSRPVEGVALSALLPESVSDYQGIIVSRFHYQTLSKILGERLSEVPVWILEVASGAEELELLKALPSGSLVVIVSQSQTVLQMGEALMSGMPGGEELLVRTVPLSEGWHEIERTIRHARLVIADVLCAPRLLETTNKAVRLLRMIPQDAMLGLMAKIGMGSRGA